MAEITVATWGKDLAFGVLQDMGREAGLIDGDQVNIEIHKGDIVISKRCPAMSPGQQARVLEAWDRMLERSKAVKLSDAGS